MTTRTTTTDAISLAASVAPEDLQRGDFVAVLNEVFEYPSFLWCDPVPGAAEQSVRVRCCASEGGTPLKVKSICLPFVFVKSPSGPFQTLDLRQVQLVRLRKRHAKTVWKAFRKSRNR